MATREEKFLAIRGDIGLATREDFFMATDRPRHKPKTRIRFGAVNLSRLGLAVSTRSR